MYVYGPVPSRRLGRSLGVSPIPPKTCSYTCIYCQLGRTDHLQIERESFYPREDILAEIIARGQETNPDYLTFVGDGEPTLSSDLGWLIDQSNKKLHLPVAVITNGSLLSREGVRRDLQGANVVVPTLDAGNEKVFRAMNRPHRNITFDYMLQGLIRFRQEYTGQLWIEVMLVKNVNDGVEELENIKRSIDKVGPDRVYILTPIRPPAESWVRQPDPETILRAQEIMGQATAIAGLESGEFGLQEFLDAKQAILEIGSRHPLRLSQAKKIETKFSEPKLIEQMLGEGLLVKVEYSDEVYLLPGHFLRGK
ncbi:MAG: radical SAM protein [candidate division Zixibacteria bacterium]|jgi:wyosine [tRNA(Phe)-imidazoG37] synthetase (radical SAM superfamily)|nr:radical SAM protein [candidate division Zixibacteria bacterium]